MMEAAASRRAIFRRPGRVLGFGCDLPPSPFSSLFLFFLFLATLYSFLTLMVPKSETGEEGGKLIVADPKVRKGLRAEFPSPLSPSPQMMHASH